MPDSFLQKMEFHIHYAVREACAFQQELFSSTGNVIIQSVEQVYACAASYNTALEQGAFGLPVRPEQYLKAGELNAMGLIDEVFHYMCRLYRRTVKSDFFSEGFERINELLTAQHRTSLDALLLQFCTLFPPAEVYKGVKTPEQWYRAEDPDSGVPNKYLAFEEYMLLKLANENPAFKPFYPLFNDSELAQNPADAFCWQQIRVWSAQNEVFGEEKLDLIVLLKAPVHYAPFSLQGQLDYIRTRWGRLLGDLLAKVLTGIDILKEESKPAWQGALNGGGGGGSDYAGMGQAQFEELTQEYERFSADSAWMPNVVMIAKSTLVWLDQLSKKYGRAINRLDQIPDEELDFLAHAGFNALWLIGVWERSKGSARIKQICGNAEAAASAYSLFDYEIAEEIGGWYALGELRKKAWARGIRLAADMVPNHTGLDARWVIERPDLFVQSAQSPFPSYTFDGENLSCDQRVGVYLENHYYNKTDCAVVFKRVDHYTGDVRYIYHGNDGTGLPWNDTAQIDFLNPEAREQVIQKILHVARNFPIIRFDAAMVLAKKHIRRLWYPSPGQGGDIASRSRFALSAEEFQRRLPEEFWREVVDRCAAEIPDTLLLAEAFWMMEGYFVRTLGMHRVYNSAFMNMLKKEENAKYRLTIKNTLEFDPEILKRYVNFMNNPDEDTAVLQFGKDDKYFGVCTMLVAMPGLPMFGHGQIEGFEEKYGMEYRRAYYDEKVNTGLVDRHWYEIFPLMKKRKLFSGVANFLLYDFWVDGAVNENVFAWSNAFEGEKALLVYNNSYERAGGWIKTSAAYAVKDAYGNKQLVQRTVSEGLQLKGAPDHFTIMQEQKSKLWYIYESRQIAESGLFFALNGFQTQIFLHVYEVADTGYYRQLHSYLQGKGTADITAALNEMRFQQLYAALAEHINSTFFTDIAACIRQCTESTEEKVRKTGIRRFFKRTKDTLTAYFLALEHAYYAYDEQMDGDGQKAVSVVPKLYACYRNRMQCLLTAGIAAQQGKKAAPEGQTAGTNAAFSAWGNAFMQNLCGTPELVCTGAAACMLLAVDDLAYYTKSRYAPDTLAQYWQLDTKLISLLAHQGLLSGSAAGMLDCARYICYAYGTKGRKKARRERIIARILHNEELAHRLGINEWDGVQWFNREAGEQFAADMAELLYLYGAKTKAGMKPASAEKYAALLQALHTNIEDSGYRVDSFISLFAAVSSNFYDKKASD